MLQLTTSRRGRQDRRRKAGRVFCFNSRPHEEVDATTPASPRPTECFNSRPHEEVDLFREGHKPHRRASTHDLTKRSTEAAYSRFPDPFWLQLTTSRRGRQSGLADLGISIYGFNSRPHEEVDYATVSTHIPVGHASTHDLTKRSTAFCQ